MTRISGYEFVINLDARQAINSINTFSNRVKVMKRVMEANFGELSRSVGSLSAYGQRLHDLARQEDEAMREVDGLRQKLAGQRAEQEKLRKEYANMAKTQDQYRAGSDKLDNQMANTQRRMANALIKVQAIHKDMEESRAAIARLATGVDSLREHNEGLTKSYKALEDSLRASGNYYRANRVQAEGLKQAVLGLGKQVQAESTVLQQAKANHVKLSEAYQEQAAIVRKLNLTKEKNGRLTVAETAELSEAQGKMQGYVERMGASSKAIGEQSQKLRETTQALKDARRAAGSFSSTKVGSFFSAAGTRMNIVKENSENLRNWASSAKSTALAFGGAVASIGTGAGFLIKKAAEVQNKFIEVRNLMETAGEGAARSTSNMNKMMAQAVTLSTKYGVAQKDIGEQYEELIKRGYSGTAALGSMNAMLKASKASGDSFNDVVKVSSTVMDSFGLRVENATKMAKNSERVNNAIASAADRTSTSFRDLGTGLAYVSGTAHNVGYSVEETAAALGELANRGMDGTRAGTGLRKVLTSLTGPTSTAEKAFKNIGLSTKDFTDKKGDLLSIDKVFQLINQHLSGKSGTEKATFYKAVFGATGMEAAQDLAKTAGEVGKTDQNITTLIKHIKQDETGNYITRLAKKNMQSTQNQMAVLKQTLWSVGIMVGQELLPTVNKVAQTFGKWVVSKDGRQSIQAVASVTKDMMEGITKRSGSVLKFITGFVEGLHDGVKSVNALFSPLVRLMDLISGKKGGGAEWMGKIAGWFLAGAAAVKLFNATFGWSIAAVKDIRGMLRDGLFGSKLSEEQAQLAGVVGELQTTNELLSQIQAKTLTPEELERQVAIGTAYKSEHGPVGNVDVPITTTTATSKTAEEAGEKIATEVGEGAVATGAAGAAGTKVAEGVAEGVSKSGKIKQALSAVFKEGGWLSKGLAIGGKIASGITIALSAIDLGKMFWDFLTTKSKKTRENAGVGSAVGLTGAVLGTLVGGPLAGLVVGSTAGEFMKDHLPGMKQSAKAVQDKAKKNHYVVSGSDYSRRQPETSGATPRYGQVITGLATNTGRTSYSTKTPKKVLTKEDVKQASQLGSQLKNIGVAQLKLKVSTDKKSITTAKNELIDLYNTLAKKANESSKKRKRGEEQALEIMLKNGTITKKQYQAAKKQIEAADKDREKSNNKTARKLVKDTQQETKDRIKAYQNYYKYLKVGGVDQKAEQKKLNKELANIDKKYASSRQKNVKTLTKNLEKTWNNGNKKELSQMKSIVSKKGKLSEKEAGKLINESYKTTNHVINNAKKQHDKTVKSAEAQYRGTVKNLKHLRDDSKAITQSQYMAAKKKAEEEKKAKIDAADKAKKGVVKQAKQQHDKTIKYAEKQSKGVSKHIVKQGNNSIDSYNAQSSNAGSVLGSIIDFWNSFLKLFGGKGIKRPSMKSSKSPHISANGYANGGVVSGGLALVGEAGPELVYTPYGNKVRLVGTGGAEFTSLKAGEHVLNARDTQRVINGNYAGTLPGYAKGTDTISDMLKSVKKASEKALKKVSKSVKNALKAPAKWVENLFSTKWIAPKTAYSFGKTDEMGTLKGLLKKNVIKTVKGAFTQAYKDLLDAGDGAFAKGSLSGSQAQRARQLAKIMKHVYPAATEAGIAAIIGNWVFESGLNSAAVNPSGGASGLGQWLGGRKANLIAYARKHGSSWTNAGAQVSFALNGEGSDSAIFRRILGGHGSVASLANAFSSQWERGGYNAQHVAGALRVAKELGYANGGLVMHDQLARVGEGNNPEMIIPLSPLKRPRATKLVNSVVDKFNAESSQSMQRANSDVEDKLDTLIDQFTAVLGQLKQVISNQGNPVPAIMGTAQAYSALNKYKKNQELKTKMLY